MLHAVDEGEGHEGDSEEEGEADGAQDGKQKNGKHGRGISRGDSLRDSKRHPLAESQQDSQSSQRDSGTGSQQLRTSCEEASVIECKAFITPLSGEGPDGEETRGGAPLGSGSRRVPSMFARQPTDAPPRPDFRTGPTAADVTPAAPPVPANASDDDAAAPPTSRGSVQKYDSICSDGYPPSLGVMLVDNSSIRSVLADDGAGDPTDMTVPVSLPLPNSLFFPMAPRSDSGESANLPSSPCVSEPSPRNMRR